MEWVSDRQRQAEIRAERFEVFDDFVDLALDNVITLDEAIAAYQEFCATDPLEELYGTSTEARS